MSQSSAPDTPRWVKVFGIIFIVLILLAVVALVTDLGGPHGPDRHRPSGDVGDTPSGNARKSSSGEAGKPSPAGLVGTHHP